jgi:hypothetical protein
MNIVWRGLRRLLGRILFESERQSARELNNYEWGILKILITIHFGMKVGR